MSTDKTISKWIRIEFFERSRTGVTDIWRVMNTRTKECIGEIRWYGANGFRGYCFFPTIHPDTTWMLFDGPCLKLIAEFLDEANHAHKKMHKVQRD